MNRQETKTERTRVVSARDEQGKLHAVEEITQFLRVEYADRTWSEWTARSRTLRLGSRHVNMLDDLTLEVLPEGTQLRVEN
jgi:hypothetical protein